VNCDIAALKRLLESSDDSDASFVEVAVHVEGCLDCQRKLTELGGDDVHWSNAAKWLSSGSVVSDQVSTFAIDELYFLEPPRSPELLGCIGRYDVESVLGRGGMGIVFRAHDSDLQRTVAVKVLAPHWAASPVARKRFAREAQAAASVAHENVIPIYNVEASAKLPYLVMLYVPGMTLQQWVQRGGRVDVGTILRVAGQMAEGLAAAHRRGLIHRDIKPANVLVGENVERVWITDFGLARAADSITLTQTGVIAGTPHYMSPEQSRGEPIDQRSDLFSFGCVLHFMCTGRPPFEADNTLAVLHRIANERSRSVAESRSDLPPSLVQLIHQLLHPIVDRRTKDCDEVLQRLADAQLEYRNGKCQKTIPPSVRPSIQVAGIGAVILTLIFVGVAWTRGQAWRTNATALQQTFVGPFDTTTRQPLEVEPELSAVAKQITDSIDDVSMSSEMDIISKQIENSSGADDLQMVSLFDDHDHDLSERAHQLREDLASLQPFPSTSFDLIADPFSDWSKQINEFQMSVRKLEASDPFDISPF
jgi:serine/threonine protein kinase